MLNDHPLPTISNFDLDANDSDEEDYTDDLQMNPPSSAPDDSSNSMEVVEESSGTSNNDLNTDLDSNSIVNEDFDDEEPENLSMDSMDNWSADVIEELDTLTGEIIQQDIGILLKKCRSMMKLMNKSSILMNYVLGLKKQFKIGRSLQLDCKNRWGSTYHLVEVMLLYKKIINKINSEKYDIGLNKKQTNKISLIELDQTDWKILDIIYIILKPFVDATNLISGSRYPTIGVAYFSIIQIRDFLEDTKSVVGVNINDIPLFMQLKYLLLKQIEKYFIENEEQWETMKVRIFVFMQLLKIFHIFRFLLILIQLVLEV